MEAVIGLGQAGCNIADYFGSNYTQYQVFKIDKDLKNGLNSYNLPNLQNHEEYDKISLNLKFFFNELKHDVLFVIGGSGVVSGATLRILEQIKDHSVTILYIRPDTSLLSENAFLQEKAVFNVLQQYARSDVFQGMIIVANSEVEAILGGVSIFEHNERLNEFICSAIHMMNAFDHIRPTMTTFSGTKEVSKLATIGVINLESDEEKLFYPLENIREKKYYYMINEKDLKRDKEILTKIRDFTRNQPCTAAYSIWSTNYEQNYVYVCAYSSMIQGEEVE